MSPCLFSTFGSLVLPCKQAHLYHCSFLRLILNANFPWRGKKEREKEALECVNQNHWKWEVHKTGFWGDVSVYTGLSPPLHMFTVLWILPSGHASSCNFTFICFLWYKPVLSSLWAAWRKAHVCSVLHCIPSTYHRAWHTVRVTESSCWMHGMKLRGKS